MDGSRSRVVIVVHRAPDHVRLKQLRTWLRWLVPAALLFVGPGVPSEIEGDQVIHLDSADEVDGPLSIASMLGRHQQG